MDEPESISHPGKANIVLAPTGIAALNVKGATLHSTFGYDNLVKLDVEDITDKTIRLKSEKRNVLKRVKTIIIDEISMVRADTFDKIDRILKAINGSAQPFGGKQMLVFGDLFQLPPVTKGKEYEYLLDRYGGVFFFHSDAYKSGNFKFIELTENHRQKGDQEFFGILNRIREGTATDTDIERLNTRYTPNGSMDGRYIALFPKKEEAERVNRNHMDQLESKEFVFEAETILDKNSNKNESIRNVFPINEELRLRLGANVMMVANDPEGRWVNGTVGIIKELSKDKIVVSFGKGKNYEVQPLNFDEQEIAYSGGRITYETVYRVMQYPIVPAYAITIHKSQGQTYDNVMCDIEGCFASGQAYVALSRCASLKGLHLKSRITPASIKVEHEVLDFYRSQLANNLLH
ncbi:MAG: AAA family ATPase [Kiritimatiellae bacterium]|nr:AAA family ATPase [Kiritimatiellia bacterium]